MLSIIHTLRRKQSHQAQRLARQKQPQTASSLPAKTFTFGVAPIRTFNFSAGAIRQK